MVLESKKPLKDNQNLFLVFACWLIMLIGSELGNAIVFEVTGAVPVWLFWLKIGLLSLAFALCLFTRYLRPLIHFSLMILIFVFLQKVFVEVRSLKEFIAWEKSIPWGLAMLIYQGMKLAMTSILIGVLIRIGWSRSQFFLKMGDLTRTGFSIPQRAGSSRGIPWKFLAPVLSLLIIPLTFLFFSSKTLSSEQLFRALPLLPFAILGAGLNAFNEEMQFRGALINPLLTNFSPGQAILITSVFFGLAHYIGGSPSGIPGFLITGALGALFAKAMIETKGLSSSWLIHFCQNLIIYSFWAINIA